MVWIDKRSVLTHGKKKYKVGDTIPDGLLSNERIDVLVSQKKIQMTDDKPVAKPIEKKTVKPVAKPIEPDPIDSEPESVSTKYGGFE